MSLRRIFGAMLREEWRLHGRLFARGRFALFPVFVALIVAGAVVALLETGTSVERVHGGLHGLAFVFGLHTGSVALIGRDSARDLLGDLTLLVFSARTLPLSDRRLIGIFVLNDVVYYAALFLLPMALGVGLSLVVFGSMGAMAAVVTGLGLWLALTGMFVLGLVVTVAGIGIVNLGVPRALAFIVIGAAGGVLWAAELPLVSLTAYGAFADPTLGGVLLPLALIGFLGVFGVVTFDPTGRRTQRTVGPAYRRWRRKLRSPVATRSLLDLHRSSGGFAKVLFSAILLFGVTVVLVELAGEMTGVSPAIGVAYGTILGMTGFTTYNWLTQFDDVAAYRSLPVDVPAVFRAKFDAFLLAGPTIALATYGPGVLWQGAGPFEALVGAVLLLGILAYIFGTTVRLTGLSPNEFLFDAGRFAAFGVAMAIPLVPILVVAFSLAPLGATALAVLGLVGVGLGIVGLAQYRRAIGTWAVRYRRSDAPA